MLETDPLLSLISLPARPQERLPCQDATSWQGCWGQTGRCGQASGEWTRPVPKNVPLSRPTVSAWKHRLPGQSASFFPRPTWDPCDRGDQESPSPARPPAPPKGESPPPVGRVWPLPSGHDHFARGLLCLLNPALTLHVLRRGPQGRGDCVSDTRAPTGLAAASPSRRGLF